MTLIWTGQGDTKNQFDPKNWRRLDGSAATETDMERMAFHMKRAVDRLEEDQEHDDDS